MEKDSKGKTINKVGGENEMTKGETYLTQEGYEKLRRELEYLKRVRKPQLSKEIGVAREHGDLKENAEYVAAKEALTQVMRRILQLETKLSDAKIIREGSIPVDKVYIGATVFLKDQKTDEELKYTLLGPDEINLSQGKISIKSPIAQGLLGHKVGDTVEIKAPVGSLKYKILKISR